MKNWLRCPSILELAFNRTVIAHASFTTSLRHTLRLCRFRRVPFSSSHFSHRPSILYSERARVRFLHEECILFAVSVLGGFHSGKISLEDPPSLAHLVVNFSSRTFADSARMGPAEIVNKRNVTHRSFSRRR
jgi:hypothetical protein